MSSTELRELADLDALGLLDEVDTHRFEQALAAATIADQDSIRTRQAELLQRLVGSPSEALPESLKQRVLAAVREDVERQEEALAPLATIGRRRRERPARAQSMATLDATDPLDFSRVRRAALVWRAASFGLAAGLIAAIIFAVATNEWNRASEKVASQQYYNQELQSHYGDGLDELTNSNKSQYIFSLTASRAQHHAVVALINNTDRDCFLKLQITGFSPGTYEIGRVIEGQWTPTHAFSAYEENSLVTVDGVSVADAKYFADNAWEIRDADGRIIAQASGTAAA